MKTYPTLYRKTSTDAIQFWTIKVDKQVGQMNEKEYAPEWGLITTTYGQVGTDSPQVTSDTISEGKNLGKKNETTPYQQAESEAKSKWDKQKKKGYVESMADAEAGQVDEEVITGGLLPMLAHKFTEYANKIVYPAFVQPKLDGMRCIAIIENGKCTLWTRTRKPILSMTHIQEVLERAFPTGSVKLDGELYNHSLKNDFERIISIARKGKPNQPGSFDAQYHVYDVVCEGSNEQRLAILANLWKQISAAQPVSRIVQVVETKIVRSEEDVEEAFEYFLGLGYEGCMVRNAAGLYFGHATKRSYDLLKVKEFDEAEFRITGVNEGNGKLQGHAATFTCIDENGNTFEAKLKGKGVTARLREFWLDHSLWKGKKATVLYQGLTNKKKVPRFPRVKTIRDYE
jgi:DNA ligase-1